MRPNGQYDGREWTRHAPINAVALVRAVIAREPTHRTLQRALYRAHLLTGDPRTFRSAKLCHDRRYALAFVKALLPDESHRAFLGS
jgi:hypothetical protein